MASTKALQGVEVKSAAKGTVEAVFSTLNEIDSDKDVTLEGAFQDGAEVPISAYGHASTGMRYGISSIPMPPVGKGVIRPTENEAILEGRFFLKTTGGRDTFELVREMGDQQDWSYSYDVVDSERGTFKGEEVNFLKSLVVHEVSPVLIGAGVDTRTLALKAADRRSGVGIKALDSELRAGLEDAGRERFGGDQVYVWVEDFEVDEEWAIFCVSEQDGDTRYLRADFSSADGSVALSGEAAEVERTVAYAQKSMRFLDEARAAHDAVRALVDRTSSLAEVRRGRMQAAKREQLKELVGSLGETKSRLEELLAESDPNKHRDALMREAVRYERLVAGL